MNTVYVTNATIKSNRKTLQGLRGQNKSRLLLLLSSNHYNLLSKQISVYHSNKRKAKIDASTVTSPKSKLDYHCAIAAIAASKPRGRKERERKDAHYAVRNSFPEAIKKLVQSVAVQQINSKRLPLITQTAKNARAIQNMINLTFVSNAILR